MLDEWTKYLDIHEQKFMKSTIKGMRSVKAKFERYCKKRKLKPTFDDIKTPLLADYVKYLLEIGNTNNTIHSAIKRMKIFMSYALKAGLHNNNQYNGYNLSEKPGRLNYLEWEEVKKLIDLKIEDTYDNDIRNLFLLGCLTAMRNGDILNLQKDSIKSLSFHGVEGKFNALHFRQLKTHKIQTIPMLPEAYDIFKQYSEREGGGALPEITRNEINIHIKRIGKAAGLTEKVAIDLYRGDKLETTYKEKWEILSTHLGRHTFISVAASRGIPMHIVAEIAGQNPKTTMRYYAGIVDKEKFVGVLNKMKFNDGKTNDGEHGIG
jgi:site-specific recombinase XerD